MIISRRYDLADTRTGHLAEIDESVLVGVRDIRDHQFSNLTPRIGRQVPQHQLYATESIDKIKDHTSSSTITHSLA